MQFAAKEHRGQSAACPEPDPSLVDVKITSVAVTYPSLLTTLVSLRFRSMARKGRGQVPPGLRRPSIVLENFPSLPNEPSPQADLRGGRGARSRSN